MKSWSFLYDFKQEDVDLEFIKDEHIRNGDVDGYKLYVTKYVDGFAKIEDKKLFLRLLY